MRHRRPAESTTETAAAGEIHLRNYDVARSHRVWLNVVDDGRRVLETTRRLRPGAVRSVAGDLAPGEYDVEVGVDGLRRAVERCRVGDGPAGAVLVEMGNGVVSVTEGVH